MSRPLEKNKSQACCGLVTKLTLAAGLTAGVVAAAGALAAWKLNPDIYNRTWLFGLAGLVTLLVAALVALLSHFLVKRPLAGLVEATKHIAQGDYDYRIAPAGRDEIGLLAEALDHMRLAIKRKTEALDESSRQFQTLFEQVPCYVSVQDRDFRLMAFNKMFERDFGHKPGEPCYRVYKGRDSKCPNCAVERTFQDGQVHSAEETVIGRDGSRIHFLNLTAPIVDTHGRVTAVMEMATDVTPIRYLEEELIKSEEKYRFFFNHDPNTIFILDQETYMILDFNDRAAAMYGRSDLIGRSFLDLTAPQDHQAIRKFLAEGEFFLARIKQVKGDGSAFTANLRASYWSYLGRQAVILSAADITKWLLTENQLIQASKMATLGEMSAGVAHELNQPLSVIGTAGSFLRKQLLRDRNLNLQTVREVAEEIIAQVERATRIINHLREFGRKAGVSKSKVSLNRPIQGVFHLIGQQLRVHDIAIELDLDPDLPFIWGDLNRLEQVFINLVVNARDAIEARRAKECPKGGGFISLSTRAKDGLVKAEVADNGNGIPAEDLPRIFEPFFTTKKVGQGTGLGLSITYGIVQDYGGSIEVKSEPGQGTTFRLTFPAAQGEGDEPPRP